MRRVLRRGFSRLLGGQRGFTLVEMLVALGIMAAVGSALVTSILQMSNFTSRGNAQLETAADMGISMRWLARDTQSAETTDLVDGDPPVSSMTLNWVDEYDGASISHSASYALDGRDLKRTYDGETHTVARRVSSVEFSLSGKLITVTLTSTDDKWGSITKQFTHYFYLRPS
ncbi:MAG: type II secretion system protein J [Dehalococcoidia bacterium]